MKMCITIPRNGSKEFHLISTIEERMGKRDQRVLKYDVSIEDATDGRIVFAFNHVTREDIVDSVGILFTKGVNVTFTASANVKEG